MTNRWGTVWHGDTRVGRLHESEKNRMRLEYDADDLAEALPAIASATRSAFAEQFGDNQLYDKLEESVRDRCGWVRRNVSA